MSYQKKEVSVLYLIDSLQVGGAEKSLLDFSKRFSTIKPIVVTLYDDKTDLKPFFEEEGIALYSLNLNRASRFWWLIGYKKFTELIKEISPDIVHAHLYKSEIIARISNRGNAKLIGAFVNDSYVNVRYKHQSFIRNLKLSFVRFFDSLTINKCDYVTSITRSIAVSNCRALGFPLGRVRVIYRGRNINEFDPKVLEHNGTTIFLAVGRLLIRKGYLELINAARLLVQNGEENFKIRIAGAGADEEQIVNEAKDLIEIGVLEFLGTINNVSEELSNAHAFIFASHYEGQGGALVEAMLSAKPIVASNIDVFKEQVSDEVSAKLFQVGDHQDLYENMKWVMNNYSEATLLGQEARTVAEAKFDIEKISLLTESFYSEVLTD
ncbi:glycosyltransferase [Roseivirga pacifica]|uniref:glycosyltransferase n=1 Tax=Roseivirga pacifica TaxID=1267423 RepID=UPI003BA93CCC